MNHSFFPPPSDLKIRWQRVQQLVTENGGDALLVTTNVNIYYLTGQIFAGFVYLPAEGDPLYFA